MDPCCGSGHFVVAAFEMLRRMRMEEERLGAAEAGDAVIRENVFGLEIDPRCTQIAAFALALAAWKAGGYRDLPLPNIACSGIPVVGQLDEWKRLAGDDVRLATTLERLHSLFREAPTLGSLINPADTPLQGRLFESDYTQVAPLLRKALSRERVADDPVAVVFGSAVEGVARAAELLTKQYTLVFTNVPFLARAKQNETLRTYCEKHHPKSMADLATVMLERCQAFAAHNGAYTLVTPHNWRFLGRYESLRRELLKTQIWNIVVNLGARAFQTPMFDFNVGLSIFSNSVPSDDSEIAGWDVSDLNTPEDKSAQLLNSTAIRTLQIDHLSNPSAAVTLDSAGEHRGVKLLSEYANAPVGIMTGDTPRHLRYFWDLPSIVDPWRLCQTSASGKAAYSGYSLIVEWRNPLGQFPYETYHVVVGSEAWGKCGVAVSIMNNLPSSLYTGAIFDKNIAAIVPLEPDHLAAIWAYCKSAEYLSQVRRIDQKLAVTNRTLLKVPFDLAHWQKVADEAGPLPEPYSNDPTQWLFKGDPTYSTAPLQVAVARLLGYRWPEQQEQGADRLDALAIPGGVACLPAVAGEAPLAERLRALLAVSWGAEWSPAKQEELLAGVGYAGKTLDDWLRDTFFTQHCALFHNRPFIWHLWDGRKDGFSALVNYHKLDGATLNRIIYTYLNGWIATQQAERDAGVAGADGRLVAALELKKKLEAIRDGEAAPDHKSGYDIYVRWKPLERQPLGWEPDLNDGVRLNVRPFVTAGVLRSKFNVKWEKDRGKNPDGSERLNDLHTTRAEKEAARAGVKA